MDLAAHEGMFKGFLKTVEWSSVLLVMLLALIVPAFAIGMGWWSGVIGWVVVGAVAGRVMNMGGAWWATLAGSSVLLIVGGAVVMGVSALVG
jgi:hypothetical protein